MLNVIMLPLYWLQYCRVSYAGCHYDICPYAECRGAKTGLYFEFCNFIIISVIRERHTDCLHAECHYVWFPNTRCHCTECRGTDFTCAFWNNGTAHPYIIQIKPIGGSTD